jgi:hypothetical protein
MMGLDISAWIPRRTVVAEPLNTKAKRDAELLRAAWTMVDAERRASNRPKLLRKEIASEHKVTPGLISHYYTGREPLNIKWQLRFSTFLRIPVDQIWPDFPYKNLAIGEIPREATDLALDILSLEITQRSAVLGLIQSLVNPSKVTAEATQAKPHRKESDITPREKLHEQDELQRRANRSAAVRHK